MKIKDTELLAEELRKIASTLANSNSREMLEYTAERLEDLDTIARFYRIEAEKNLKRWRAAQGCIWFSVDELPKENGTYLIVGKSGTVCTAHFYAEHIVNGRIYPARFSNKYVKVWAHRPEPPKEITAVEVDK